MFKSPRFSPLLPALLLVLNLFPSVPAWAEDPNGAEPEIVIREEDNKTFYEYRVNGILQEIKVVPKTGAVYYLVPSDGGGWIREERSQVLVPKWILLEW